MNIKEGYILMYKKLRYQRHYDKDYIGYKNYRFCTEELIEDLTVSIYVYRKVN